MKPAPYTLVVGWLNFGYPQLMATDMKGEWYLVNEENRLIKMPRVFDINWRYLGDGKMHKSRGRIIFF